MLPTFTVNSVKDEREWGNELGPGNSGEIYIFFFGKRFLLLLTAQLGRAPDRRSEEEKKQQLS